MHVSGARLTTDISEADIVMQFDDKTTTTNARPLTKPGARFVNLGCNDISKSMVAEAWERASGYTLAVDPRTHKGPMVEKSEMNGSHDGRIIEGPQDPADGKTYQRLIDNEIEGGMVEDLRTCICGGKPAIMFRKRRPLDRRFANDNLDVTLDNPKNVFTEDELAVISRFADEIGMDWGGVDVLRDRATGKIFIVDANKTDMGPPIALKLGHKLRATRRMAKAFATAYIDQ